MAKAGKLMPDYIYLLENRLSADQRNALRQLREAAREAEMILFLTGDAVRDLTSGHAVRDLEVAVHGNALKLKKAIEKLGAAVWGESESTHTLYLCFPGTVRVDVVSTHRMDYTHLEKPVYHPASIQEDLRRRDFTVNAMAISLNEGSFGLLMDPLNGAADIETRTLRLVSNYGFLEEPSLLIRATRYIARLGWEMDPKTRTRYDNAKGEEVIERLSAEARSRELEQIGHEDDGLKVLRALEDEGWMKFLFPAWTAAKADEERLKALHDLAVELLMQGVHPDMSAAQMQLLTAKLSPKDLAALKQLMLRRGFVEEWNSLDALAAKFAKVLLSKEYSTASAGFKLFTSYDPEAVLWLGFTTKDKAIQERFNLFLKVWPEARQRIPHALMQEMRITSELATYPDIVQAIFLELIDGHLTTPEETRAFLEPHSPPAPPPKEIIKRPRAKRGEAKLKERAYDDDEEAEDGLEDEEDLDDLGGDEDEIDLGLSLPKADLDTEIGDDAEPESAEDDLDDDEPEPPPAKRGQKSTATPKAGKDAPAASGAAPAKLVASRPEPAGKHQPPVKGKAESKVEHAGKHSVAQPKPATAGAKDHVPHAKVAPAPIPAKATAPAAKKPASAPVAKKDEKVSKPKPSSAASKAAAKAPVKAHHVSNTHGAKHPHAKAVAKPKAAVKHKVAVKHKPAAAKGKPVHKTAPKPSKAAPPAKAKKPAHKAGKKR
jgi:tRNA nucleotidyltransferase (CCA-adding enzyme)